MLKNYKKIFKQAAYKILSSGPLINHWRKTKLADKFVVLMYHEIAENKDKIEAWTVVKKGDFIRQMGHLLSHFNIISLKNAITLAKNKNLNNGDKPSAVITFDDGYAGNHHVLLPIIKSMNIPTTIFVATRAVQGGKLYWYDRMINSLQGCSPIELNLGHLSLGNYQINYFRGSENWRKIQRLLSDLKALKPDVREDAVEEILKVLNYKPANGSYNTAPLSIKELKELADCQLITIGAHSHCHNILTQLTNKEIRESINTSKELLESWTGKQVEYFSYPNGNYNDDVIGVLRESGFECSLTTVARPWEKSDSFFTIPRIGIGRYDSLDYFKIKVSGYAV